VGRGDFKPAATSLRHELRAKTTIFASPGLTSSNFSDTMNKVNYFGGSVPVAGSSPPWFFLCI